MRSSSNGRIDFYIQKFWVHEFVHELVYLLDSFYSTGGKNWDTRAATPNSNWHVLIDESVTPSFELMTKNCYENPFPEFENYERLFRHRGGGYHSAMLASPNARDEEFKAVVSELAEFLDTKKYSDLATGENILLVDLPSGGNYLSRFLPPHVTYKGLEVTKFTNDTSEMVSWSSLPFSDNSVHVIATVAALHHLNPRDRTKFYSEVFRVLHPEGAFLIADVAKGSFVDPFLNNFVDTWNSHGHDGLFFDAAEETKELKAAGFLDVKSNNRSYPWKFNSESEMNYFVKYLFGLDRANETEVSTNVPKFLNVTKNEAEWYMPWELIFFTSCKTV